MRRKRKKKRRNPAAKLKTHGGYGIGKTKFGSSRPIVISPQTAIMMAMARSAMDLFTRILFPNLPQGVTGDAPGYLHPEGLEKIKTEIDEHQMGRSEVIREIANPKDQ